MASVFRKKNRQGAYLPSWYASFQVPIDGGGTRQVHRSTNSTSKKDAMVIANRLEQAALKEASSDDETSKVILSKLTEATDLAIKGRLNLDQARRLLNEIMEATGEVAMVNYSVREWLDEWLSEKERTTKPSTAATYRAVISDFSDFLGDRADSHLETVTTKDIRQYRDSVLKRGRTSRYVNQKVKVLSSVFKDAVKVSALLKNPTEAVSRLNESDVIPKLPFNIDEVTKLLAAAPCSEWKGMIMLGAFAGVRIGDISQLRSGDVDLERKVITFTPIKTSRSKKVVSLPIHDEILGYFETNPPSPFAGAFIFPNLSAKKVRGSYGLSQSFADIMAEAGVSAKVTELNGDGSEQVIGKKSFHSLRHMFTSQLAKADVPEEVRMKFTGHSDSSIHQQYTHIEMESLRSGIDKIPSLK